MPLNHKPPDTMTAKQTALRKRNQYLAFYMSAKDPARKEDLWQKYQHWKNKYYAEN